MKKIYRQDIDRMKYYQKYALTRFHVFGRKKRVLVAKIIENISKMTQDLCAGNLQNWNF